MKKTIIALLAAIIIVLGTQAVGAFDVTEESHGVALTDGNAAAGGKYGIIINSTQDVCVYNITKHPNNLALYCYIMTYDGTPGLATWMANGTFNGDSLCVLPNSTRLYQGSTYVVGTESPGAAVDRAYSTDANHFTSGTYINWTEGFREGATNDKRLYNIRTINLTTDLTNCGAFAIDNCSSYVVRSHNFTFYNSSGASTSVQMSALATVDDYINVDYYLPGVNSQFHQICTNDPGVYGYTNLTMQFTNSSYATKNLAYQSLLLDSTIDTTKIEMVLLSDATDIVITVVDQNEDVLTGYLVETWKYNLSTNTLYLFDSQFTNALGQVVVPLKVADEQYEFYVKDGDNTVVYTEPRSTLTETSYTFRVILDSVPSSPALSLADLNYTFIASRTDYMFRVEWNDLKNVTDAVMLETIYHNVTDVVVYNLSNSTATQGVMTHNLSGSMTGTWVGTFYAQNRIDGNWYLITGDSIDYREAWSVFGTDSLFMAFFFIGTLIFLGITTNPIISLVAGALGLIAFSIMGFVKIAMAGLVGAVVMLLVMAFMVRRR